jgi:hypothetical protein
MTRLSNVNWKQLVLLIAGKHGFAARPRKESVLNPALSPLVAAINRYVSVSLRRLLPLFPSFSSVKKF